MTAASAAQSGGEPFPPARHTAEELYLVDVANRYRGDPATDAARMPLPDPTVLAGLGHAVDWTVFARELAEIPAAGPVLPDGRLCRAARNHARYLRDHRVMQHHERPGTASFTGVGPRQRVMAAGWSGLVVAENCTGPSAGLWNAHVAFVVDWARSGRPSSHGMQEPRGHRLTLSGAGYTRIGIGVVADERPGRYWVVQLFGRVKEERRRLAGVVFVDRNRDGLCDPGEGLAGIRIAVTDVGGDPRGETVTGAAGLWCLDAQGPGPLTVRVAGGEASGLPVAVAVPPEDRIAWLRCALSTPEDLRAFDAAVARWERVAVAGARRTRLVALLAVRHHGWGLVLRGERAERRAAALRELADLDPDAAGLPATALDRYRTGDHAELARDLRAWRRRYRGTRLDDWLADCERLLSSYGGVAAFHRSAREHRGLTVREIDRIEARFRAGRRIEHPQLRWYYRDLESAMQTVSHGPAR